MSYETNAAAPSETVDLVATGFSITFIIEADGRVEIVFQFSGPHSRVAVRNRLGAINQATGGNN